MDISNYLDSILNAENEYIDAIKVDLCKINETITEKAEHDLRMGFRAKAIIDIKLTRVSVKCQPMKTTFDATWMIR